MAEIRSFAWLRHLGSEPSFYLLRYKNGSLRESGKGLSFFFLPMGTSVVQVPIDDKDLTLTLKGRAKDFQEVTINGIIIYRVVDPVQLSERMDFTIDLGTGFYLKQPISQVESLLNSLAQQSISEYMAALDVRKLLQAGLKSAQDCIGNNLLDDESLGAMGIEVVSVRVFDMKPTSELEKALEAPTRESIQQSADEATFSRRALAVEKERAIAENELQSKIELAKREHVLIEQEGENSRRIAQEEAEAKKIKVVSEAEQSKVTAGAESERIRMVESVKVNVERERMDIYKDFSPKVMMGLAARELAGKLEKIEHLNITPDTLGTMLSDFMEAGTHKLKEK